MNGGVGAAIAAYRDAVDAQRAFLWDSLADPERDRAIARRDEAIAAGAPSDVAADCAALSPLASALDIADLARAAGWEVEPTAYAYRAVGALFALDRLRLEASAMTLEQHWDRLAMRRAGEDLFDAQKSLTGAALRAAERPARADRDWAHAMAARWAASLGSAGDSARGVLQELESQGGWTFAKVTIATAEMRALASAVA